MTDASTTLDTTLVAAAPKSTKTDALTFMWAVVLTIVVVFAAAAVVFGYAGVIVMAVAGAFTMLAMLVVITLTGL